MTDPRQTPYLFGLLLTAGALCAFTAWTLIGPLAPVLWVVGIAAFLAIGLSPLVRMLSRRVPRSLAIVAVSAAGLLALGGIVLMIVPAVVSQVGQLLAQADEFAASGSIGDVAAQIQRFVPLAILDVRAVLDGMLQGLASGATLQSVSTGVIGAGAAIGNGFFLVTLTLILTVYFLVAGRWLRAQLVMMLPRRSRAVATRTARRIGDSVARYFLGTLVLAVINGVLTLVILLATGSALPLLFAAVALVCALVPLIGIPLGGAIIVLSQALFTPANPMPWIVLASWYLVYMMVEAYVLAPRVIGRAVALREVVVVLATIVAGALYGIVGALLAVPVAVAVAAVIREVRDTRARAGQGLHMSA